MQARRGSDGNDQLTVLSTYGSGGHLEPDRQQLQVDDGFDDGTLWSMWIQIEPEDYVPEMRELARAAAEIISWHTGLEIDSVGGIEGECEVYGTDRSTIQVTEALLDLVVDPDRAVPAPFIAYLRMMTERLGSGGGDDPVADLRLDRDSTEPVR